MSWIQNLDHLDQRFISLTRGDIPVGLRWRGSTGGCRCAAGVLSWQAEKIAAGNKKILDPARIGTGRFRHANTARPRNRRRSTAALRRLLLQREVEHAAEQEQQAAELQAVSNRFQFRPPFRVQS